MDGGVTHAGVTHDRGNELVGFCSLLPGLEELDQKIHLTAKETLHKNGGCCMLLLWLCSTNFDISSWCHPQCDETS